MNIRKKACIQGVALLGFTLGTVFSAGDSLAQTQEVNLKTAEEDQMPFLQLRYLKTI